MIFVIIAPLLSVGDLNRAANAFNVKITPHMVTSDTLQIWVRKRLQASIDAIPESADIIRRTASVDNAMKRLPLSVPFAFQSKLSSGYTIKHVGEYPFENRYANPQDLKNIHGGRGMTLQNHTIEYVPSPTHNVPFTYFLRHIEISWNRGRLFAKWGAEYDFMTGIPPKDLEGRTDFLVIIE